MRLNDLIVALPGLQLIGDPHVTVSEITFDSRQIKPGSLFVALRGSYTDGHRYLAEAVERGATALIVEEPLSDSAPITQVVVPDSRAALATVVAAFFGNPSHSLGVIGVTGTDGKTTTSYLINAMLEAVGYRTGLIGTVDIKIGSDWLGNPSRQTTPESLEIQRLLKQMVEARIDWAIVESTSHGLALHRLDHVAYDAAVLTNVTHEHLEFHGTFERYRAAKASLFERLSTRPPSSRPCLAVVNADDANAEHFVEAAGLAPVITYGLNRPAMVTADDLVYRPEATTGLLRTPRGSVPWRLALIGEFNVANALAAAALGVGLGLPLDQIATGLSGLRGVPGRLERIDQGQPFLVVVDYAHTPESLAKMLRLLRPLTAGRLIAVFGSAGERDVTKRALQGRISAELADISVLTSEDPRFEDAAAIVAEIAAGAIAVGARVGETLFQEPDRQTAVHLAIGMARAGDTVLLAGKGHEQSIIVGADKLPWDDRLAARTALTTNGWNASC